MLLTHKKNAVRYYLIVIIFLAFLFFSNDFGLIDVQKTAIVMAAGIDREEEDFVLTSQIAVPKSSDSGNASEAVQIVSRGKTIAQAFEQINAKTGWYPKLVFCNLILFGKDAAEKNVFDALDFFLRVEYLTDDCQLAVCEGTAQELLNTSALVDPSSSVAMRKVLSDHAERVGTVFPSTLKDFSIGYYGDSQSGTIPVLKTQPQQEKKPQSSDNSDSSGSQNGSESEGESASESQSGESSPSQSAQGGKKQEEPVFSAQETALFVRGRWVDTLTAEETFAVNATIGKLRLANYSVQSGEETCTLVIKRNLPKVSLDLSEDGKGLLRVSVNMIAGVADYSKAEALENIKDMGSPPDGVFAAAEKKLSAAIITAYEKAKQVGCDVFGLEERLIKYKRRKYFEHKDTLLSDTALSVTVKFGSLR